jgi:allantoinase
MQSKSGMTKPFEEVTLAGTQLNTASGHFRIRRDPIHWPGKARVAVTWTVVFDLLTGPSAAYSMMDAVYSVYGGKRGLWRLLDVLGQAGVRATVLTGGAAAEQFPEAVRELKRQEHEIAAYGVAPNLRLETMDEAGERDNILKALSSLEAITGEQPAGWVSPDRRPGKHTLEILAEEGLLWNGDFPNDDLPYVLTVNGKRLVIIPYGLECDDREIYGKHRHPTEVWLRCFRDSLEVLYEEGATHPKMLNVTVHAHLGRSLWAQALASAIRFGRGFSGVWFATRTEIARWWLEQGYD